MKIKNTSVLTTKKVFSLVIAGVMCASLFVTSGVHAQQVTSDGNTYLTSKACTTAAIVHDAYDIDFGEFNAEDVMSGDHTNSGVTTGGTLYTYDSVPGMYLVVEDVCAKLARHADILAGNMVDQNVPLASDIPAVNLKLTSFPAPGLPGDVAYPLNGTPTNPDVTADSIATAISFNTAVQLMERTPNGSETGGIFGVSPNYELIIPQYQQADTYQGTITWTVI